MRVAKPRPTLKVNMTARIAFVLSVATWLATGGEYGEGSIGFRLTTIPDGSAAQRAGMKVGDVLVEREAIAGRLKAADESGAKLPVYRYDVGSGVYRLETAVVKYAAGEERRLGVRGDLGFLFLSVKGSSNAERAGIRVSDFVEKINDTFVHADADLAGLEKLGSEELVIHISRWDKEAGKWRVDDVRVAAR